MPTPELEPQPANRETVEPTPLEQLIDEVRQDAKLDPKAYARDAIVPEGGE
jgi:hypothetical protein